jgi:hypothetical protein
MNKQSDSAWKNFVLTGKVSEYINYCNSLRQETANEEVGDLVDKANKHNKDQRNSIENKTARRK